MKEVDIKALRSAIEETTKQVEKLQQNLTDMVLVLSKLEGQGTLPEQNKYETVAEAVTAGELVITVYGGDYAERSNSVDDAFSDQEVERIDYTEFVDSFTEALRKGAQATDEFKSKLTSFAVAEFGNVQMYAGKNKISEELFSIILRRQKAGKVTVLTGDTFTRQHVFEPLLSQAINRSATVTLK